MRKVVVYIAMSLDGFIAKENDDISFLAAVERPGEDYGYSSFIKTVDTVIMGRKSYDKILTLGDEFWHKGRKCYVFSRSRKGRDEHVEYYNGRPEELIKELRQQEGKDIFVDGGAELIHAMMQADLIDYYTISIIPVLLELLIIITHRPSFTASYKKCGNETLISILKGGHSPRRSLCSGS